MSDTMTVQDDRQGDDRTFSADQEHAALGLARAVYGLPILGALMLLMELQSLSLAVGLAPWGPLAAILALVALPGLVLWTYHKSEMALIWLFFMLGLAIFNVFSVFLTLGLATPLLIAFGITCGLIFVLVEAWMGLHTMLHDDINIRQWKTKRGRVKKGSMWFVIAGLALMLQAAAAAGLMAGTRILTPEELQKMQQEMQRQAEGQKTGEGEEDDEAAEEVEEADQS